MNNTGQPSAQSLGVEKDIMEFTETLLDEARKAAAAEESVNGSSEPSTKTETTPAEPATPASTADDNDDANGQKADDGVSTTGKEPEGTEPEGKPAQKQDFKKDGDERGEGNEQRRKPLSKLQKAEFAAAKWKKKAKELQAQRDDAVAEYNKYKDLNPAAFADEQERADFIAWKAAQRQRISNYEDNLDELYETHEREEYENKIAECYNEEGAAEFEELDNHYGGYFNLFCNQVDPHNVILDFLRNSKYEPAIRNVIYEDDGIQRALLERDYGNPHIADAKRLAILEGLERSVKGFYDGLMKKATAPAPAPAAKPQAQSVPPTTKQNNNGNAAPVAAQRPTFTLPPRRAAEPVANNYPAPQQASHVPPAPPQPTMPPRKAPQVTGALTRGNTGNGPVDPSVGADALFSRLFQNN